MTVSKPSLLSLPYEIREYIYDHVFQERISMETHWRPRGTPRALMHSNLGTIIRPSTTVDHVPPRAVLVSAGNNGWHLTTTLAIARSSRSIQDDLSTYLEGSNLDIVAVVRDFDYKHVSAMLASMSASNRKRCTVQPDVSADHTRKLKIALCGPYDDDDGWLSNLSCWLGMVGSLLTLEDELHVEYKIVREADENDKGSRAPLRVVVRSFYMHQKLPRGPAKDEAFKLLCTFWGRYRVEGPGLRRIDEPDDLETKAVLMELYKWKY